MATDPSTGESAGKLTLTQIRSLPRVEIVTELKCIEGWSRVAHWIGPRFVAARYPPAPRQVAAADNPGRFGATDEGAESCAAEVLHALFR